jgi:hypothetical protein
MHFIALCLPTTLYFQHALIIVIKFFVPEWVNVAGTPLYQIIFRLDVVILKIIF